jgi:hypothetical protein
MDDFFLTSTRLEEGLYLISLFKTEQGVVFYMCKAKILQLVQTA